MKWSFLQAGFQQKLTEVLDVKWISIYCSA